MSSKILVVDDEPAQLKLISQILADRGYEVITAGSGQQAVRAVYEDRPDLIVMDVMMPGIDGMQACTCIREVSDAPIILLTGRRNSEEDIVRGLEAGADEYLTKPVGNRELLARVRAVLRRAEKSHHREKGRPAQFSDGYLLVDVEQHQVIAGGVRRQLTPREFRLLVLLLENAGRVVTHRQALERVWGWEYINDVDYVRIYISHLRQKIEPDPARPCYIITEPGVGYRFTGRNLSPLSPPLSFAD